MTASAEEVLKALTDDNFCELTLTWYDPSKQKLIGALEAVLAMPKRRESVGVYEASYAHDAILIARGYNQCLADVRKLGELLR